MRRHGHRSRHTSNRFINLRDTFRPDCHWISDHRSSRYYAKSSNNSDSTVVSYLFFYSCTIRSASCSQGRRCSGRSHKKITRSWGFHKVVRWSFLLIPQITFVTVPKIARTPLCPVLGLTISSCCGITPCYTSGTLQSANSCNRRSSTVFRTLKNL